MDISSGMFSHPLTRVDVIERKGVIRQMNAAPKNSILYIHAPSGYGKTTVAATWLLGQKAAWFSLDRYSADAASFFKGVLLALSAGTFDAPFDTSLEAFLKSLSKIPEWPVALVIDDFHLCTDKTVALALPLIRTRMPVRTSLVILSRIPPPETLHDHILKGVIREITDLQFNRDEVIALFKKKCKFITKYAAEMLLRQTEGWAVALSALLFTEVDRYSGVMNHEALNHYLMNNIIEFEHYNDFKKCGICDTLNRELCISITKQPKIWDYLTAFSKNTGLVTGFADNTYRFHSVLRDFLETELMRDDSINKPLLYKTAAIWYKENGDWLRALDMAAKSGDISAMDEVSRVSAEGKNIAAVNVAEYAKLIELKFLAIPAYIIEKYPRLSNHCFTAALLTRSVSEACIWADILESHMSKGFPNPDDNVNATFLLSLDIRYSSWHVPRQFERIKNKLKGTVEKLNLISLTFNFPFFHKAQRDYTDIAPELSEYIIEIGKHMEPVLGPVFKPLALLVEAGIRYECGQLSEAEAVVDKVYKIIEYLTPELYFCTYALYTEIRRVQGKRIEPEKIGLMIERTGVSFLCDNYNAYLMTIQLYAGHAVAEAWLEQDVSGVELRLHNIYRGFVTARALLTVGRLTEAEALLESLVLFAEDYRRTVDSIEGLVLLSICNWHMKRKNEAVEVITPALIKSAKLGLIMPVAKEGNDILPILQKILSHFKYGYDTGKLDRIFVSRLVTHTRCVSDHIPGMLAGNRLKAVTLSPRQAEVLGYLEQSLSYKEIAGIMGVKTTTVDDHIRKLHEKLNASTTKELILKARKLGIL